MHIAIVSHHRLPKVGYGGTTRIVTALVQALARLGHRVTLIAPAGTRLPEAAHVEASRKYLTAPGLDLRPLVPPGVDLVHAHYLIPALPTDAPFLQTLYGNMGPGAVLPPNNVFLTRNHARRHGGDAWVYCGLDPAGFTFRRDKDDYDLFIGRLHSIKGYRWAIAGAKHARRRLIIAGGWRPSLSRYVRYVGGVDGSRKRALLAGARCVWMPALWEEPFGLTLIEPLFSGTPVLGTRRGSLPEILTPEVGALCDTLDEMIEAARAIATRSPDACRAHAERYFSHLVMAEEYVRVYRHLLATGVLPAGRLTPWVDDPRG